MSVAAVSSQDAATGGSGAAAIDGQTSTMWHSAWSQVDTPATYPHWITIDLGDTYSVNGFDDQVRRGNGAIKDYEISVHDSPTAWGAPVAKGSFADVTDHQHLALPTTTGRYVTLKGLSSQNGGVFGGAGEINVWGSRLNVAPVPLPTSDLRVSRSRPSPSWSSTASDPHPAGPWSDPGPCCLPTMGRCSCPRRDLSLPGPPRVTGSRSVSGATQLVR